ncbi:MAG: hypothetical protein DRQ41_12055 [Gammaproteobacteria bacterium]|nr:MAG: hypothetical protein DRQ41_12055 [Gammaproteobacteria bacterium]RKZ73653.1 MAG: hypothetical protein DRQ57_13655 [Gammaproteobacteria bacterium]
MKYIDSFKFIKKIILLLIIIKVSVACAVRSGPALITGFSFANMPEPPPIIAVPLGTETERGLQFTLNAVLFETGNANLFPEGKQKVEAFASVIQLPKNISRTVLIEGHTDSSGRKKYNLHLSKRRAEMVKKVLITQGVDQANLVVKAFGENNPIATNVTSQGRQQNRRVEIIILNEGMIP